MSIANFSGEGNACIVRKNCNEIKPFTSKSTATQKISPNYQFSILNYENSIIGKRLLSLVYFAPSFRQEYIGSDGLLNFISQIYVSDGILYNLIHISGVYKKCNYSSKELQKLVFTAENSKTVIDHLKSIARSEDEFNKLLESDASLKKSFLKLNAKV
jgi:hypothetical protein